jgi:hypothetical protein
MKERWEVWGLASGRKGTKDAAPGAFTVREYAGEIPTEDWKQIIIKVRKGKA